MYKRISALLLLLTISIMLSSCSAYYEMRDEYPDLMGKAQTISDGKGGYYVKYDGQRYNIDKLNLFRVREFTNKIPEEDVFIAWDSLPFGIWYLDKYYSYTVDNPIFIYLPRLNEVYIRSDYNYQTDTFVVEGTDHKFVFSDMFTLSNALAYSSDSHRSGDINIVLYSTSCNRLRIHLRIFCIRNVWFAGGDSNQALFEVSDEFLKLINID